MTRKVLLVTLISLLVCTGFGFEASCTGSPQEWRLTIEVTEGGMVWTPTVYHPGVAVSWHDAGEVVSLKAVPAGGYQFVGWTGKVWTIEDVNAAETTITMELDYTITANFAPKETGE
jgi:uncharacterized repeat protein (TIGR02543 family)